VQTRRQFLKGAAMTSAGVIVGPGVMMRIGYTGKPFLAAIPGGTLDPRTLAVEGDDEMNWLLSHYAVLEMDYGDPGKICTDCIDRIRQQGSSKRIKTLLAAIQAAESRGDREQLDVLQRELIQMRKGGA